MKILLKNASCFLNDMFEKKDILVENLITHILPSNSFVNADLSFDFTDKYIFPGFADVHVHFREPGFSYKETIKTGSMAAASSGYTHVCTMPNLIPCPDSLENLNVQLNIIKRDAAINVIPFGSITKGEKGDLLSDMSDMKDFVCGYSDDGVGLVNDDLMKKALIFSQENKKVISCHCEFLSLIKGGKINDCSFARQNSIPTISDESEWKMIERDIELLRKYGGYYHVCHISTAKSVELIRSAKKDGLNITCETAPHYLCLDDTMIEDSGKFKMNPPLRSPADRQALIDGILDGTIDMIATDHAPHSLDEKNKGVTDSLNGIVGLECAFPVLYTNLVKTNIISLEKLIELMSVSPKKRFNLGTELCEGKVADLTVFDLDNEYTIDTNNFKSKGKCTPFENMTVYGKCLMTICNGKIVWEG